MLRQHGRLASFSAEGKLIFGTIYIIQNGGTLSSASWFTQMWVAGDGDPPVKWLEIIDNFIYKSFHYKNIATITLLRVLDIFSSRKYPCTRGIVGLAIFKLNK